MKIFFCIVFFTVCSFLAGEETTEPIDAKPSNNKGQAFGGGLHFKFSIDEWNGAEQLISRLKKGNKTYLYLRISREEFNIKKIISESKSETLFKFFLSMPAMAPYLRDAVTGATAVEAEVEATATVWVEDNQQWVQLPRSSTAKLKATWQSSNYIEEWTPSTGEDEMATIVSAPLHNN